MTQVRLAIYSPAGEPLPASIALFLAHCISLVGAPESPLYPTFMRFLLQRSTIDARDVPMFYSMLYSSNADEFAASPRDERAWMVRFLTEGLVRTQVRVYLILNISAKADLVSHFHRIGRFTVAVKSLNFSRRSSRRPARIRPCAGPSSR